jgi:hypothetical protein
MAYLEEIKGLLRESDRLLPWRLFLHRDKFTFTKICLFDILPCIWKKLRNFGANLCNKLEYNSSQTQKIKKYLTPVMSKVLHDYVFQKSNILTPC